MRDASSKGNAVIYPFIIYSSMCLLQLSLRVYPLLAFPLLRQGIYEDLTKLQFFYKKKKTVLF